MRGDLVTIAMQVLMRLPWGAHEPAARLPGSPRKTPHPGTPLDPSYPRENELLQARIAAEHLLISQFAPGTKTQRFHFPQRNRTMALISDATMIVEAGETSGSLSQGWEALRLGRLLYITRALADDPALRRPSKMLDHGAQILSDATLPDFLEALPSRLTPVLDAAVPF
ncbi:DNA-processing protein DprA [Allochromatium tepidum]|uniref:Smf/DprA SLOG domain-containing protein n=1 Tax=Allochromatium tepidum TaxID=553982 RepID=A0ABN6GEP9_9GAMM|nr:DNA-processing protein DprA [Allochromatium tepidum]BCU08367.1 hypothetical protein Atep_30440 [Allochromatium tepidum]